MSQHGVLSFPTIKQPSKIPQYIVEPIVLEYITIYRTVAPVS